MVIVAVNATDLWSDRGNITTAAAAATTVVDYTDVVTVAAIGADNFTTAATTAAPPPDRRSVVPPAAAVELDRVGTVNGLPGYSPIVTSAFGFGASPGVRAAHADAAVSRRNETQPGNEPDGLLSLEDLDALYSDGRN